MMRWRPEVRIPLVTRHFLTKDLSARSQFFFKNLKVSANNSMISDFLRILPIPLALLFGLSSQAQNPEQIVSTRSVSVDAVLERSPNHQVQLLVREEVVGDKLMRTTNAVTVLGTGINYWDEASGSFVPTKAEFVVAPGGEAVITTGPHKVILSPSLSDDGWEGNQGCQGREESRKNDKHRADSPQQPQGEVGYGTGNGQTDGNNTSENAADVRHEEQFVSYGWLGQARSKHQRR